MSIYFFFLEFSNNFKGYSVLRTSAVTFLSRQNTWNMLVFLKHSYLWSPSIKILDYTKYEYYLGEGEPKHAFISNLQV